MYKTILVICLVSACVSLMALQNQNKAYEFKQNSENAFYEGILSCDSKLTTNSFQSCKYALLKEGKALVNTKLIVSGGMPAHQHGLPTAPKAVWSEDEKSYLIKGLKFSMPGEWLLNFKLNTMDTSDEDTISMTLNVK